MNDFFHYTHNASWPAPHNHNVASLLISHLGHEIKRVIARCIALPIMENDGCSLISAHVTNPNIIKVAC